MPKNLKNLEENEKVKKNYFKDKITFIFYIQVWICEFCENHNRIHIEDEEIPKKEDIIYIVESVN